MKMQTPMLYDVRQALEALEGMAKLFIVFALWARQWLIKECGGD